MKAETIRASLLRAGVKNLHEFGYPQCDTSNILTDAIFRAFFARMLEDTKGRFDHSVDRVVEQLHAEVAPPTGEPT